VLLVGALFASTACTYGATVAISRWTGLFATRPARFLDWGTKTGLLRITGTAFQFRHETYRQWLTDHPASD
jgi:hypothetical protein